MIYRKSPSGRDFYQGRRGRTSFTCHPLGRGLTRARIVGEYAFSRHVLIKLTGKIRTNPKNKSSRNGGRVSFEKEKVGRMGWGKVPQLGRAKNVNHDRCSIKDWGTEFREKKKRRGGRNKELRGELVRGVWAVTMSNLLRKTFWVMGVTSRTLI